MFVHDDPSPIPIFTPGDESYKEAFLSGAPAESQYVSVSPLHCLPIYLRANQKNPQFHEVTCAKIILHRRAR